MKKKIYLFLILALFILLFCSSKSFATLSYDKTTEFTVNGIDYTIPDKFLNNTDYTDSVVITTTAYNSLEDEQTKKQRVFYVYLYNSSEADLVYSESSSKVLRFYSKNSDNQYSPNSLYSYYCYDINGIYGAGSGEMSNNYQSVMSDSDFIILHSTSDIYNSKVSGNSSSSGANYDSVFFQQALMSVRNPETLKEAIQGMKMEEIQATVVKMIAMVVGLVVFLIALRKGFKVLVTSLRQS